MLGTSRRRNAVRGFAYFPFAAPDAAGDILPVGIPATVEWSAYRNASIGVLALVDGPAGVVQGLPYFRPLAGDADAAYTSAVRVIVPDGRRANSEARRRILRAGNFHALREELLFREWAAYASAPPPGFPAGAAELVLPLGVGATLYSEDFAYADGTELQGITDSLGNVWACAGVNRMEVFSAGARRDAAGTTYRLGRDGASMAGDAWASAVVVTIGATASDGCGPSVQMNPTITAQAGYSVQQTATTGAVVVRRDSTTLATYGNAAPGDVLRVERIGTTWYAYKNGVLLGSGVDATYAAGHVGVTARGSSVCGTFRAGDFSAPPTPGGTVCYARSHIASPVVMGIRSPLGRVPS